jgi:peroxiredoxin
MPPILNPHILFQGISMNKLDAGDQLPDFNLQVGEGNIINLPSDISTDYAIILFYRGHW